jgi:hypothetical protein
VVHKVSVGGRCGVTSREGEWTGVGEAAVVGLGGDRVGKGGVCGGGIDVGRRHHQHPSAAPPHSIFLPPFSSASQAEAMGPAMSRAAMVRAEVVWPAGAWARSEVLGTVNALQHWQPDRVNEGVCNGVSGLRRWRLALDKL